ncbi:hypothetical protein VTN77DRAFT_7634 [Rasamsonia byssochlamydoides]|uniref:uncharacterized protein n=1 Tax=Rasamsonia byssochlamydoides TaxID=89139 RepID=UPI003742BBD3
MAFAAVFCNGVLDSGPSCLSSSTFAILLSRVFLRAGLNHCPATYLNLLPRRNPLFPIFSYRDDLRQLAAPSVCVCAMLRAHHTSVDWLFSEQCTCPLCDVPWSEVICPPAFEPHTLFLRLVVVSGSQPVCPTCSSPFSFLSFLLSFSLFPFFSFLFPFFGIIRFANLVLQNGINLEFLACLLGFAYFFLGVFFLSVWLLLLLFCICIYWYHTHT